MTKRKENAVRGRPSISRFTYRLLRKRWEQFRQDASMRNLSAPDQAAAFIKKNRAWLNSHRLYAGQYSSLKNDLSKGLQERRRTLETRQILERRRLLYLRAANASVLGLARFPGVPFGESPLSQFQ